MIVTVDKWSGVINEEETLSGISAEMLPRLIYKLDGNIHTMMTVVHDGMTIGIGGGPKEFILTLSLEDGTMLTRINERKVNDQTMIEIKAGGQFGEYMAKYILEKEQVSTVLHDIIGQGCVRDYSSWEFA